LDGVAVGSPLSVDSGSDLGDTLELFIPELLRRNHGEWEKESIDGFFFSSALKTRELSARLMGTCILISDQTVTPFSLELSLSQAGTLRSVRVRLGEPGAGALGISGPAVNSPAARKVLLDLMGRIDRVDWAYDISV
jgi:hypothetical protein